ncbi:membrane protein insertase YidC [Psychrobacter sp. AOP22-C1-22]|uniref:membrane protein insertase YidC n=1 Tax=unclassified Psychrobacter TaxID=196806 RepID=UPI001787D1EA|nr:MULTISPECIES: membrane protein insertase YidC [unclassified Psychrobacter]MDN5801963.1 membrane protein insertase YidC [Psychrobacter sp.]MBE0405712.1 membrane protein insertase YidC [Psychrobacter sp. FME6]MBE0444688.1 membrane protein insertase YidC [Psychrobacter sp. FME5]MDN5891070.1 membrane protein insertase YidC [Psychrobacter sp.]MDN5897302.1 membrane protein insertase YidC [Psychrobacter sp.]
MQKIFRVMIIIAMLITAYLLILAWRDDYADAPAVDAVPETTSSVGADIPSTTGAAGDIPSQTLPVDNGAVDIGTVTATPAKDAGLITVTTDRYDIKINPEGGDIVYAALKQYDATLDSDKPFVLLENNSNRVYVAQSGLIGQNGIDTAEGRANYSHTANNYVMEEGQQTLSVPLTYKKDGVTITKTFTFTENKYPIDISYQIQNASTNAWQGQMFAQLKRDDSKDPGMSDKGALSMATYLGGAWGTPDDPYNKLKFGKFSDSGLATSSDKGWVGIVQHYFVSAWTPENFTGKFFSRETGNDYFIGFNSEVVNVAPSKQMTLNATLYAGPKVQSELKDVAVGLNKTVDYGLLWPISKILFAILDGIHKVIGNWGWSIIGLTVLVKIALMWFSNKSYYSMAKMRAIAPRLAALKEEHGDDRMKMSQEMMGIYKEEKVNPMAGCLPILMQMPIFLALYWVLVESVELRHAPWILWIQDLSAMDPWFILPLLMGASMFTQQQLNPQPADPMQAKVMKFLPIIFTAFMLFFPAGLVLYWTVNNLFSMTQQYIVNKKVEEEQKRRTVKVVD